MASEFYQKTTALHEEFRKRERHYLNMVEHSNNSTSWKNNLPLQDYLLKIHKREQETEETYKNCLKQMEEMDRRTEMMAQKLERLDILKNSFMNSSTSSWSEVDNMYNKSLEFHMPSTMRNPDLEFISPTCKLNISTQTKDIYCEQCNSPVSVLTPSSLYAASKSNLNENSSQIINSLSKDSFLNRTDDKQLVIESTDGNSILHRTSLATYETFSSDPQSAKTVENVVSHFPVSDDVEQKECSKNEKLLQGSADFKEQPVTGHSIDIHERQPVITERKYNSNNEEFHATSIKGGTVSMKSDDESMNHEFDFLESEKKNSVNKIQIGTQDKFQVYEKEHQMDDQHSLLKKSSASVVNAKEKKSGITLIPPADNLSRELIKPETKIKSDKINEVTDSSISAAGPHSPSLRSEILSVASDSDSMFEKEIPLTATAAYQAMLGNTVLNERTSKKQIASDSESEDEVENALANAVKKSGNTSVDLANQNQNDSRKETLPQAESKTATKVSKPGTVNKPSKLSKNTRKVLGLDTSSGSEVELEVKPNTKNNEDSDEFDFYN